MDVTPTLAVLLHTICPPMQSARERRHALSEVSFGLLLLYDARINLADVVDGVQRANRGLRRVPRFWPEMKPQADFPEIKGKAEKPII